MNIKQMQYHVMGSDDFDRLVRRVYGESIPYEFVAAEEANNYSAITYNGMVRRDLDAYDRGKLNQLLAGEWTPYTARTLLQDMVNRAVLSEGNYLIEIYW